MARKYLNDIGVDDNCMQIDPEDHRWPKWNKQIEEYGFPEYETWNLDFQFYGWLYERLKMYSGVNCVDLTFHKFNYEGEEYTQAELIDKMIHGCELAFLKEYKNKQLTKYEEEVVYDVPWIWATVMPAMWW
jgi:hypothetical protein